MSINLRLIAEVDSHVKGKKRIREEFNLFQTPTEVTRAALASANPRQYYIEWVKQFEQIDKIPQYAPEDVFCTGPVIGYDVYNAVADHIMDLHDWFHDHEWWRITWGCS